MIAPIRERAWPLACPRAVRRPCGARRRPLQGRVDTRGPIT